jgi:uncharacterized protein YbjT (DUF2867 family)
MARAFAGTKAVYAMIPPHYGAENFRSYQKAVGSALVEALRQAEVPHVVALSSLGAQHSQGVGPICGLHDFEQSLSELPQTHVLLLRPAFFMENLLFQIEIIKKTGVAGSPVREDVSMPMIAISDIAAEAAMRLQKLDFTGKSVRELLGQRDLTMPEAVSILGKAIGRERLAYVRFEYEDVAAGMRKAGFSAEAAAVMSELYKATNEGLVTPTSPRSAGNTTPTSIEQFAQVFAAVYNQ